MSPLDAVDIAADGIADQAVVEGLVADPGEELQRGVEGLLGRAVGDQLDADEEAAAADVADMASLAQGARAAWLMSLGPSALTCSTSRSRATMVCTATPGGAGRRYGR